jgi:protein SCO1/2
VPYHLSSAICLLLTILLQGVAAGQQTKSPGIDEKIGQTVPLDLVFFDENGDKVTLRQLTDKPTIISLVYYSCSSRCPLLLGNLAQALSSMGMDPVSYRVLTVSFDDRDTAAIASEKKRNYIKAVGRSFPDSSWRFLTGDKENINKLTDSLGFSFRREPGGFSHPRALIFLSPGGVVARYLYGMSFLPFDVEMSLQESSLEKSFFNPRKLALFCYSYDPEENRYVFNLTRSLTVLFFLLLSSSLAIYLVARKREGKDEPC